MFSRRLKTAPWGSLTLSEAFFAAGGDPTLLSLRSSKTYDAGLVELEHAVASGRSAG